MWQKLYLRNINTPPVQGESLRGSQDVKERYDETEKYAPARSCCGSHCRYVVTSWLPVYAKTWDISEGSITVEADGEEDGKSYNKVTQGDKETVRDTDTVITGKSEKNTVTTNRGGGRPLT